MDMDKVNDGLVNGHVAQADFAEGDGIHNPFLGELIKEKAQGSHHPEAAIILENQRLQHLKLIFFLIAPLAISNSLSFAGFLVIGKEAAVFLLLRFDAFFLLDLDLPLLGIACEGNSL